MSGTEREDVTKSNDDENVNMLSNKHSFNFTGVLHVQIPPTQQRMHKRIPSTDYSGDHNLGATENHFILLPHHNEPISHFALDIGGSLIKMVYLDTDDSTRKFHSNTLTRSQKSLHRHQNHQFLFGKLQKLAKQLMNYLKQKFLVPVLLSYML
jgi:hypothetical protein